MITQQSFERKRLYSIIYWKLKELGISSSDYPLDSIAIAKLQKNLTVEHLFFKSIAIGGVLFKGKDNSIIGLNRLRSEKGQNFDCMHELIHYWFHPADNILYFHENFIIQDRFKEWQANEGAAQFLMPVELFTEKYLYYSGDIEALSNFFYVSNQVITYRIENLQIGEIEKIMINEKLIILR